MWFFVVREGQEAYFCFAKSSERGFEEATQRLSEVVSGTVAPRWAAVLPESAEDGVLAKVTLVMEGSNASRETAWPTDGPRWASPTSVAWAVWGRLFPQGFGGSRRPHEKQPGCDLLDTQRPRSRGM